MQWSACSLTLNVWEVFGGVVLWSSSGPLTDSSVLVRAHGGLLSNQFQWKSSSGAYEEGILIKQPVSDTLKAGNLFRENSRGCLIKASASPSNMATEDNAAEDELNEGTFFSSFKFYCEKKKLKNALGLVEAAHRAKRHDLLGRCGRLSKPWINENLEAVYNCAYVLLAMKVV